MPDQRTLISTEDSSQGGVIVMFIADKPKDLSSVSKSDSSLLYSANQLASFPL